ncbi:unnamed protein product [Microthlaspi erraticum]|uniref:RING-type domain-containing protein n=1 Tax=Microthlaspi erraticum TaxID=1685480 RepID=A0A6D2IVK3_9BRAS|nr:unnamed protein product [Microthlaspi erraticum]
MGLSYGGAVAILVGFVLNDLIRAITCTPFLSLSRLFDQAKTVVGTTKIPMNDIFPAMKFVEVSRQDPPISCQICQEKFDGDDQVRCLRNCVHVFHQTCLDVWIQYDKITCPLCRTPIVPDFYFLRL